MKDLRIAIIIPENREYERGLLRGMLKYSRLHGPFTFLRNREISSGGTGRLTVQMIRDWAPDGIIWRESRNAPDIRALNLPTIFIPFTEPDTSMTNIITDDHAIGKAAAEHLLRRGLKKLAWYGIGDNRFYSRQRKRAFIDTASKADCKPDTYDTGPNSPNLKDWMKNLGSPTGLMLCTDDCSTECYETANRLGLRIPDDIALIGVGNDEMRCDFSSPPLSSIALNTEYAGYEAARAMVEMIRNNSISPDITVSMLDITERQSTGISAIEDELIARAIRFIHENVERHIHVNDVVEAIPLSRRSLYKRFTRATGRSIYGEIQRTKMDHAARLLIETDLPIAEIAESLGFPDAKNLARSFQRERGTTPFKYRTRYSPYR